MSDDDRYITRVWYQDGVEYTSRSQRISLREIQQDLKISDDDIDRMFPEPLQ